MATVKISGLPAASAVVDANEFEINEAGTSKKVTGSQISAYVQSQLSVDLTTDVTGTLPAANGGTGLTSPGTAGNLLTSNGTAWTSAAPPSGGGQFFGSAAVKAIAYNANTISENVTVTTGNNGLSAGPITISSTFTVTVQTGAVWVIV
jgi:hypothetical protein